MCITNRKYYYCTLEYMMIVNLSLRCFANIGYSSSYLYDTLQLILNYLFRLKNCKVVE